ncbi:ABC transporter substrate-binding protein [Bordetella genomosp. 1]|uniref:ABC transporter substrate-binding protein n=1 Tax=Bordetella genomosp. 1 TaxID=1395607 RepID=A0ABX4EVX6_9BORD|nr:ABC transporter substrate-binding protein [Bordetella genomosp. 1]OZI58619.1 ABC transporter substrate-binding protein [Bordetella genomosp. 1]
MMDRRRFCAGLLLGGLGGGAVPALAAPGARRVTDMAGRQVTLAGVPRRILLLEARDLLTMALLVPDPAARVAGWAAADRIDSAALQARLEDGRRIPVVGRQTPDSISLEGVISLAPDLVVASSFMAPERDERGSFLERMRLADIPVVFSDVASNGADAATSAGPVADLRRYLRMWGEILDAEARAQDYLAFADRHLARIAQGLGTGTPPVTTYLEVQSTVDDCCWAAGQQVWGELLALAGGRTLPAVSAAWYQKLQLEYLLATPHDVYIASGGGWAAGGRPAIGPGLDPVQARAGLQRLLGRPGFAELASTRNQRVHGIWTGLIAMRPLNILFVEVAAKWLHPERFPDLDPAATLAEINARFLARPIDGPLWVSLKD